MSFSATFSPTERLRAGRFKLDLAAYRRILPWACPRASTSSPTVWSSFLFNHTILRVIGEGKGHPGTIISYVNTLVLMTMTGTAQGMQPLVSFHLGERKNCHRLLKYGVSLIAAFSVAPSRAGRIRAPAIVSAFLPTDSAAVFSYSISALRMYSSSFLVLGLPCRHLAAFFTAVERPVFAFSISFGRSLVLLVASLLILSSALSDKGTRLHTLLRASCLCLTAFCAWRYSQPPA